MTVSERSRGKKKTKAVGIRRQPLSHKAATSPFYPRAARKREKRERENIKIYRERDRERKSPSNTSNPGRVSRGYPCLYCEVVWVGILVILEPPWRPFPALVNPR